MQKYQQLPPVGSPGQGGSSDASPFAADSTLRCAGCASKIGAAVLDRVLGRLEQTASQEVLVGLKERGDAAVVAVAAGHMSVQTIDFFRILVSDPYRAGQITAHHCLNDIFAMGGTARTAMAMVALPFASERCQEEQLFQLLSGLLHVLKQHEVALVGGHTTEAADTMCGLSINGIVMPEKMLRKNALRAGDQLILTKPLGTGVIFAAHMRRQAKASMVEGALKSMLLSNHRASDIFRRYGAAACTDITGFGLLGHLLEMLRNSTIAAEVRVTDVSPLPGAVELFERGLASSMAPANRFSLADVEAPDALQATPHFQLLIDPQTSGGLLAGIPPGQAAECLEELRGAGYTAATIGGVRDRESDRKPIIVV